MPFDPMPTLRRQVAPATHCAFCGRDRAEVAWLFQSKIGGLPPAICDDCAEGIAAACKEYDEARS